jgi:hypothetical protein
MIDMGVEVISFCQIEITKGQLTQDGISNIEEMLKHEATNVVSDSTLITFQLSGHNGVDYAIIEDIKKTLNNAQLEFTINATEYSECDNGYYYSTDDEVEGDMKDLLPKYDADEEGCQ